MQQEQKILAPASIPQEHLLNSDSTVTLYAGSAGSGKTYALLLTALKFAMVPNSTLVIFRRTSKMLLSPGSIWHEAVNMYTDIFPNMKVRHRDTEMVFPNGSLLKFSHMQHASNVFDHKGAQYSFVAFDEATDFEEQMIMFMMSRMRNAYVNYTPQMFLCTNPDYNSFLREWIQDFYLDAEGVPLKEKSNVERFFVIQNNRPVWYNSKEEAEKVHGASADNGVRTFRLIRANVRDNIPLLKAQPEYISNLMAMDRVQRLIMLEGSWYARPESLGYFKRTSVNMVPHMNLEARNRVLALDFAFSEPSEVYKDPDYTAWVVMSKSKENRYTIEVAGRMRKKVHDVEKKLFELAAEWGQETVISIPVDPNAQAAAYAKDLQRRLAEQGYTCKLCRPVKSKVVRFQPFAAACESGYVDVVQAAWNNEYFDELEWFLGDGKQKDDSVDATSDAFYMLNRSVSLPQFTLPDLSQAPIF